MKCTIAIEKLLLLPHLGTIAKGLPELLLLLLISDLPELLLLLLIEKFSIDQICFKPKEFKPECKKSAPKRKTDINFRPYLCAVAHSNQKSKC